jgi:hypothetical protein
MAETKRSQLELYDYLDRLMTWSENVLNITSKYLEAQAPKHPLDFPNAHQGIDAVLSIDYFARWIRHLEKRMGISEAYLETISRGDHQARLASTSAIASNGSELGIGNVMEISANRMSPDTPNTDSTLEPGEIREHSKDPIDCSEVWWCLCSTFNPRT